MSRAAAPAPAASGETHVVRPGESLWSIAKRLAGPGASAGAAARLANSLWQLNAATIRSGDPDLIHVGDRLRLPAVQ
jgi:Tfp pilus assembly protein FimV